MSPQAQVDPGIFFLGLDVAALNVPACLGKSNFCLQASLRKLFT